MAEKRLSRQKGEGTTFAEGLAESVLGDDAFQAPGAPSPPPKERERAVAVPFVSPDTSDQMTGQGQSKQNPTPEPEGEEYADVPPPANVRGNSMADATGRYVQAASTANALVPPRRYGGASRKDVRHSRELGQQQEAGYDEAGALAKEQASNEQDYYTDLEVDSMMREEELKEQEAEAKKALDPVKAELEAKRKQVADASDELATLTVDPGRYMRDGGTRARAIIGMAVSGLGTGLIAAGRGGITPNAAAQAIERNIDRDIAAQEANIDQKNKGLAAQRGVLADLRDKLGDEEAAQAALKNGILERYARLAEQRGLAAKSEDARIRGEQTALEIRMQKVDFQKKKVDARIRAANAAAAAARRADEKQRDELKQYLLEQAEKGQGGGGAAALVQGSGYQTTRPLDKEDGKYVRATLNAANEYEAVQKELYRLTKRLGVKDRLSITLGRPTPLAQEYMALRKRAITAEARLADPVGALNQSAIDQAANDQADALKMLDYYTDAGARSVLGRINTVRKQTEARLAPYGIVSTRGNRQARGK